MKGMGEGVPGVEAFEAFFAGDPGEAACETSCEPGLGDQADTGGFEGAEDDVGEEFGDTGGSDVDGCSAHPKNRVRGSGYK